MKVCSKCKVEKDHFDFNRDKSRPDGLCCWCRTCHNTKNAKWCKRQKAPSGTLGRYGLSKMQYELLAEEQKGMCKICDLKPDRNLSVDHCHKTHKVRGLLCGNCNTGLGMFKDDPALLARAIKYLTGEP